MGSLPEKPFWPVHARRWLAERLRYALYYTAANKFRIRDREATVFEAILERWEQVRAGLTPAEAAGILNLGDPKKNIPPLVSLLRERLRLLSREEPFSALGIELATRTYELTVRKDPPHELLKKSPRSAIGLLFPHSGDWFVGNLVGGAIQACENNGYVLVVKSAEDSPDAELEHIKELIQTTEGVLIVPVSERFPAEVIQLLEMNHAVFVDRYLSDVELTCVRGDDKAGGRLAGKYLKKKKCGRVLVVSQNPRTGEHRVSPLADRLAGCREGFGKGVVEVKVQGHDEKGGYKALEAFQKQRGPVGGPILKDDGVFALTDKLAFGCRTYLSRSNSPVSPERVVGYEGQDFGEYLDPPLVSIKLDDFKMGKLAAEILIRQIKQRDRNFAERPRHEVIPVSLIRKVGIAKRKSSR